MHNDFGSIETSEEAGVRYLHFGSDWIQGAMRIRRPNALELAYTREMMACLLLRNDEAWPKQVLLIGLGAGSLLKFFYHYLPQTKITVIEINPEVVPVARHFFKLPEDPRRIRIEIADGVEYVSRKGRRFDLIMIDGFDADAKPGQLDSMPFYESCRARLADKGMLVVNLLGGSKIHKAALARLHDTFDGNVISFPSEDKGNLITFASESELNQVTDEELKTKARSLKADTGLDLLPTLERLLKIYPSNRESAVL
ncbi:MAG: fused MFS/spermidine synthase [Burkholderiales bacterium]